MFRSLLAVLVVLYGIHASLLAVEPVGQVIDARYHHLGDSIVTTWKEANSQPEGIRLDLPFEAKAQTRETILSIKHRDIDGKWDLVLNGKTVAQLKRESALRKFYYSIPPNLLRDGTNLLSIISRSPTDDISVGDIQYFDQPLAKVLRLGRIHVTVRDAQNKELLPTRLTVLGSGKKLVDIFEATQASLAVRSGLVYTATGEAEFSVPAGSYTVVATRGMEWSRAEVVCEVGESKKSEVVLQLRREVDTKGFIASDTHIHTFTFSGHGDSTVPERMVTIAAEGVELAISTDHNHHTDYQPEQQKLGLNNYFTPMTGNEVTTKNGHFNAFPLSPKEPIPNHKETNWVKLAADIRSHGAKVIIFNHPRWPNPKENPLTHVQFNQASGDRTGNVPIPVDGFEIANSTSLQKDPLLLFRDWFALLNHGEMIKAIGSSDSHTVGDPVGQGRTYVRSSTDDPTRIDSDEMIRNFQQGRTSISLGLFSEVIVDGQFGPGDIASGTKPMQVRFRVASPAWITPRRALVFMNGQLVAEKLVQSKFGQATDEWLSFKITKPRHDSHLVCIALGDGIKDESWKTYADYTLAATNPVWIDADGDGKFTTPRETARLLLRSSKQTLDSLKQIAQNEDGGLAVQAMSLARSEWPLTTLVGLEALIESLAVDRPAFALYRRQLQSR